VHTEPTHKSGKEYYIRLDRAEKKKGKKKREQYCWPCPVFYGVLVPTSLP
jgi:hypothetical protein